MTDGNSSQTVTPDKLAVIGFRKPIKLNQPHPQGFLNSLGTRLKLDPRNGPSNWGPQVVGYVYCRNISHQNCLGPQRRKKLKCSKPRGLMTLGSTLVDSCLVVLVTCFIYWQNRNHNISQGRPSIQYTASNNLDPWDLLLRVCESKILVREPWFMGGYQFSTGDYDQRK